MKFKQKKSENLFNHSGQIFFSQNQNLETPALWFGLSVIESPKFQIEVFQRAKVEAILSNAYDIMFQDKYNKRKEIIEYFRDKTVQKMDSGGFQLMKSDQMNKNIKNFTQSQVFRIYKHYNPDIGVQLDYPLSPNLTYNQQNIRINKTLENFKQSQSETIDISSKIMPVVHGYHLEQINQMTKELIRINGNVDPQIVGIGSLVPLVHTIAGSGNIGGKYSLIDNLLYLRALLPNSCIHAFGIGGTMMYLAFYCGIDTLDSNGWVQKSGYGVIQLPGVSDRFLKRKKHNRPYLIKNRKRKSNHSILNEIELFMNCQCDVCKDYVNSDDIYENWERKKDDFDETGENGRLLRSIHNVSLYQNELELIRKSIKVDKLDEFIRNRLQNGIYMKYYHYIKFFRHLYEKEIINIKENDAISKIKLLSKLFKTDKSFISANEIQYSGINSRKVFPLVKILNSKVDTPIININRDSSANRYQVNFEYLEDNQIIS